MTETPQPTSGSLSAKIIRACPSHRVCPLTCKQRLVEDLGEIASFSVDAPGAAEPSWLSRVYRQFFAKETS